MGRGKMALAFFSRAMRRDFLRPAWLNQVLTRQEPALPCQSFLKCAFAMTLLWAGILLGSFGARLEKGLRVGRLPVFSSDEAPSQGLERDGMMRPEAAKALSSGDFDTYYSQARLKRARVSSKYPGNLRGHRAITSLFSSTCALELNFREERN